MVDISFKSSTLRLAVAEACIAVSDPRTIEALKQKKVPKGDVFEVARTAGLLAIKRTSDTIPDCHPLPIEYATLRFNVKELQIYIEVEVKTIYKTGVEVEAMYGASVAALTCYDMLKPLDSGIEIRNIRLLKKNGGKSDYRDETKAPLNCAVVVCSDSISQGKKQDEAGKQVRDRLLKLGLRADTYLVLPDEKMEIRNCALELSANGIQLILFVGGTGLSARDVTPEAIEPILERNIPGIMEAARHYGQQRTPYAMLSRGLAGFIKNSLIVTLPGSTRGAIESMEALFPYLLHIFKVAEGMRHEQD